MIARGWWPLQRWLAARPALAIPLACAPVVTLVGAWRPPAALWSPALAAAVALLVPVVIAGGDGSRRRLAGRATGAALVIALPLLLAALLVDVQLLVPIAAAAASAVLLPAVLPVRAPTAAAEVAPELGSTRARWLVPLAALAALGLVMAIRSGVRIAVPDLDANMIAAVAGCAAFWFAISMRPLLGLAIAAATVLALAMSASSMAAASPITVALALPTPLAVWFQRESAGGFPAWTPAVITLATATAYAADPAGQVMMVVAVLTWLVAATYPAHAATGAPDERSRAGIITWSQRVFAGLEPYWRFYARGKLSQDPIYDRLAGDGRTWGRVLDAGCGPGLTAMLAAGRGDTTEYLGIDLDVDKLLVARRALWLTGRSLGGVWRLRRERLPLAPPPPERFDTILVIDVLHYWPDDVQATTLGQLASLLQTTGRLYLREAVADADADAGRVERGERFTTFFGLNPENELTFLSTARIAALIAGAGLAVEREEPMGGENRLWVCRRS